MRMFLSLPALTALTAVTLGAAPVDLTKIDRTLAKEPAYQSKAPQYCLVVFGPEAKTRVWLVLDGNALYVDRNGNGDLTDPGERIEPQKARGPQDDLHFKIDKVADAAGKIQHANLTVELEEKGKFVWIEVAYQGKQRMFASRDAQGQLAFAGKPQAAPIVHFGGPLTMQLSRDLKLTRGEKLPELYAELGTPGLGNGTFAALSYQQVPANVHPVAEITFPNGNGNGPPLVVTVPLDTRC